MTWVRVSCALLCAVGMHGVVACGGNSSDSGEGVPSSAGQSFAMAGNAGQGAEAAGTSGGGATGIMGGNGNAGASSAVGASGNAAAECTDLVNDAPAIEETYVSGAAPAATGGVVHDGTYFETAFVNYGVTPVTPAPIHRFTARVTGSSSLFEAVYSDTDVSNSAEQRIAFVFETSGTEFKAMRTCLNGVVGFAGYDATATTLTLHLPSQRNGGGITYTLTKQ